MPSTILSAARRSISKGGILNSRVRERLRTSRNVLWSKELHVHGATAGELLPQKRVLLVFLCLSRGKVKQVRRTETRDVATTAQHSESSMLLSRAQDHTCTFLTKQVEMQRRTCGNFQRSLDKIVLLRLCLPM